MNEPGHEKVLEANRRYYNEVAENYLANEAYAYTPAIRRSVEALLTRGAGLCGKREMFLDFGCGSGFLSRIMFEKKLMASGIGIDASDIQVELYNKALAGSSFKARVGDALALDLADASIDMAGGYSVLHHFFDYSKVLDEITRVLRPGGVLYFDFEPNRAFKRLLKIPILVRRCLFDKSPETSGRNLEKIAEYHNNFEPGISRSALLEQLEKNFEIIDLGCRIPETSGSSVFKILSKFSFAFSPCFYVLARKKTQG